MTAWDRLLRWADAHRFAVDAAGTALAVLVLLPVSWVAGARYGQGGPTLLALALVVPLAWRRVAPVGSAAAVYTVGLAQLLLAPRDPQLADVAVLAALYSVTVHGPRWAYRVAVVGALVGGSTLGLGAVAWGAVLRFGFADEVWRDSRRSVLIVAFVGAVVLGVWAFGLARRARRETIEALIDRTRSLELERDQQHRIATAAERARIAREMHDIVAHSLTVMVAQADGGRYAGERDPSAATRALGTIGETGRAALADMRRLLGVLRTDPTGTTASPESALADPRTPQPAERDVSALVEQLRAGGLRISFVRVGAARHLPPGTGLTVYRIAQEALTNVLKHAGPDPAVTVLVAWHADAIVLEVDDDGRGAAADGDGLGQGLLGMRERAAMFGGAVSAGPRPGGGFRVRARIPTTGAVSTPTPDDETQEDA